MKQFKNTYIEYIIATFIFILFLGIYLLHFVILKLIKSNIFYFTELDKHTFWKISDGFIVILDIYYISLFSSIL